nr:hypothetical protein [Embleya scabrispora]
MTWSLLPGLSCPKVKRLCSSVAIRVEPTVTSALAAANGTWPESRTSVALLARPTPPPKTTKRTKEAITPGVRVGAAVLLVVSMSKSIRRIAGSPRTIR